MLFWKSDDSWWKSWRKKTIVQIKIIIIYLFNLMHFYTERKCFKSSLLQYSHECLKPLWNQLRRLFCFSSPMVRQSFAAIAAARPRNPAPKTPLNQYWTGFEGCRRCVFQSRTPHRHLSTALHFFPNYLRSRAPPKIPSKPCVIRHDRPCAGKVTFPILSAGL